MKKLTFLLLGMLLLLSHPATAEDKTYIKESTDLHALGENASERNLPILIMFSQKNCVYCSILEEDYLRPMLKSGDYGEKVIIRKVRIDSYETLRNFDGSEIVADQFASQYRAYVTPTMVFLDHTGKELTKRLMGVGTEGYFAAEIDKAIDTSLSRIRSVALSK